MKPAPANPAPEALLRLLRALVRKDLLGRKHRRPTDKQVNASIEEWIARTGFYEFAHRNLSRLVRDGERELGKPIDTWSAEELERHQRFQAKYFDVLREDIVRGKGRPEKRRQVKGIINSAIRPEHIRAWSRRRRKESVSALVNQVVTMKKRLFASTEGFKTISDLDRAMAKYPRLRFDIDNEVSDARAIRETLEQLGLPVTEKSINKYKMRYSRAKGRR